MQLIFMAFFYCYTAKYLNNLSGVQGQSPSRGSEGRSPPEAEAKCEISIQFLDVLA